MEHHVRDVSSTDDAEESTTPLARALRQARVLSGLSEEVVARVLNCSLTQLAAIEAGVTHPDVETIDILVQLYGLNKERLGTSKWVPRSAPQVDTREQIIWIEWLPIPYGADAGSNAEILGTVADHLRFIRSLPPFAPVRMRVAEIDLVVGVLDRAEPNVVRDFANAMRLPWKESADTIEGAQERVWNEGIRARAMALLSKQQLQST